MLFGTENTPAEVLLDANFRCNVHVPRRNRFPLNGVLVSVDHCTVHSGHHKNLAMANLPQGSVLQGGGEVQTKCVRYETRGT